MVYIVNGARVLLDIFINITSIQPLSFADIDSDRRGIGNEVVYFRFENMIKKKIEHFSYSSSMWNIQIF